MRLYHPQTLQIFANREDISKRFSCSVWSEVFKWKASKQKHPKMFIDFSDKVLGCYMGMVYDLAIKKGCNLDKEKIKNLGKEFCDGWDLYFKFGNTIYEQLFDSDYLFSDACSLYFKGVNIFPDIYGNKWRRYVPVESLEEILRQVKKTLQK